MIEFFEDEELTRKLTETSPLDFGLVEIGSKKELVVWVQNVSKERLSVIEEFSITGGNVRVESYPHTLKPLEKGEIRISWRPSLTLERKLEGKIVFTVKENLEVTM